MRRFLEYFLDYLKDAWWFMLILVGLVVGCSVIITTLNWEKANMLENIFGKSVLFLIGLVSLLVLFLIINDFARESRKDSQRLRDLSVYCQLADYEQKLLKFSRAFGNWKSAGKGKPNAQFVNLAKAYTILMGLVDNRLGLSRMAFGVIHRRIEETTGVRVRIWLGGVSSSSVRAKLHTLCKEDGLWKEVSPGDYDFVFRIGV